MLNLLQYIDKRISWDVSHRIQRSYDYNKPLRHCWYDVFLQRYPEVEATVWVVINVVFKNIVCKPQQRVFGVFDIVDNLTQL